MSHWATSLEAVPQMTCVHKRLHTTFVSLLAVPVELSMSFQQEGRLKCVLFGLFANTGLFFVFFVCFFSNVTWRMLGRYLILWNIHKTFHWTYKFQRMCEHTRTHHLPSPAADRSVWSDPVRSQNPELRCHSSEDSLWRFSLSFHTRVSVRINLAAPSSHSATTSPVQSESNELNL